MRIYSKLLLCFLATLSMFLAFSAVSKAETSAQATVDVSVNAVSTIAVTPTTFSWTLDPGLAGTAASLNIRNTGSQNVSSLYAYVDTLADETVRPYGTGDPSKYAAGGVIVFRNSTNTNYYFAGRLEWNWTSDVAGKSLVALTSPVAWGFFKNTTYDYFWGLGNGTGGFCNNTGAQFAIENNADNGTTASRTPVTTNISRDGGDANYGYFSIGSRTPFSNACIAAYYDCSKIYVYKYDKRDNPNFASCTNSSYIQVDNLTPGDFHTLTLNAYIPVGVPAGSFATATFTVVAS